jgi:phenylalanyl-tRNA synthetase alpha chain
LQKWLKKVEGAKSLEELEEIRIEVFGKKGFLAAEFLRMKELDAEAKKELAKELNDIKEGVGNALETKKEKLSAQALKKQLEKEKIDVALIDTKSSAGALHPVLATMDKMIEYFISMNFSVETGPIVENDFNNFEALNLPKHHPARDMQDTFYMKDSMLLRTHTSSVQIRTMLSSKPPIRMIAPGA